jgi:hydroxymethylpyrimidine/phosphomethylpyrimidine kinase
MVSKSGHTLLNDNAVRVLATKALPLALVVTPNVFEAQILARQAITTIDEAEGAARAIHASGRGSVVVKGGHLTGLEAVDVIFDGSPIQHLTAGWGRHREHARHWLTDSHPRLPRS